MRLYKDVQPLLCRNFAIRSMVSLCVVEWLSPSRAPLGTAWPPCARHPWKPERRRCCRSDSSSWGQTRQSLVSHQTGICNLRNRTARRYYLVILLSGENAACYSYVLVIKTVATSKRWHLAIGKLHALTKHSLHTFFITLDGVAYVEIVH